jgi:hypothetical protein
MLVLANRSDLDLSQQITAPGATWIDHRLVERDPMPLAMGGFGREARDAMQARAEHLAGEGLARRHPHEILFYTKKGRAVVEAGSACSSLRFHLATVIRLGRLNS